MNTPPTTKSDERSWGAPFALPYLLALSCCLTILQQHTSDIPPLATLAGTLIPVLVSVMVVQATAFLVLRTSALANLTTTLVVSYIGLHSPISALFTTALKLLSSASFVIVWTALHVILLTCVLGLNKTREAASRLATAATVALAILVPIQSVKVALPIISDTRQLSELDRLIEQKTAAELPNLNVDETRQRPDIYYIIPDAYARQDVLRDVYGHDNDDFIESLQERGFFVSDASRSNYVFTEFSLASSLNMRHLREFDLSTYQTRMPLRHLIRNSAVGKTLNKLGYQTYAVETGKSETECDNFDHYAEHGAALDDYQDVLYHGTPLPNLLAWTGLTRSAARLHGDRVLFAIDQVPQLVKKDAAPAFVFCHLLAPHPPYLFDGEGNEVEYRGRYLLSDYINFSSCYDYDMEVYRNGYREQIKFMNKQLITMIDRIQKSDRPSVIVLQSDHGPRLGLSHHPSELGTPESCYRESFSILNAIAIPGQRHSSLTNDLTPVNTFRLLLNELFGTALELHSNESYTNTNFEFQDVTHYATPANKKAGSAPAVLQSPELADSNK